jgi:hypothetical protein
MLARARPFPGPQSSTFSTPFTAYYRGAMGIILVYDVCDENSFNNIRNWMRNIEQHASDNVVKVLVGNKCDIDSSKRAVSYNRGQVGDGGEACVLLCFSLFLG